MDVEVSSQDLITSLSGEDHLDTHGLDLPGKKVHGSRGSDGRNVVGLEVVDDFFKRIESLLNGEGVLVVSGSEVGSSLSGGKKIRRVLETDGERVKAGPCGDG